MVIREKVVQTSSACGSSYILHKLGTPTSRKHSQIDGVERLLDLVSLLTIQVIQ